MYKAPIREFIKMSVVDGPGNRAAIFFQGCNMNCQFCHNPETIEKVDKTKNNDGFQWMNTKEVFEKVKQISSFITGVTFSGGEPLLQKDFLVEILPQIKELGLNVLIDTNGLIPLENDKYTELVDLADGFMVDIKSWDTKDHQRITSVKNDNILKNVEYLASIGKLDEIRTVCLKGENNEKIINNITKLLSPYLDIKDIRYKLISYRPYGVREEYQFLESIDLEEKEQLKKLAIKNGFHQIELV